MFAQKVYPEQLGNGSETIAEAGCFVTAFSNLLSRYGEGVDPLTLNNFFKSHNDFIGADDLGWSSVNAYDHSIVVKNVGNSGLPDSNDAIVKFHYNSVNTGKPIDHFCLVDSIDNGQLIIVDSWDGLIKGPAAYESVYHSPIAWATYIKNIPQSPAPAVVHPYTIETITPKQVKINKNTHEWGLNYDNLPAIEANPQGNISAGAVIVVEAILHHALGMNYYLQDAAVASGYNVVDCDNYTPTPQLSSPSAAPIPIPATKYTLNNTVMIFKDASDAVGHNNAQGTLGKGVYYVYNTPADPKDYGMLNLTKDTSKPGSWINPKDDVAPDITAVPVEAPTSPALTVPPVTIQPAWQTTYKPYRDVFGEVSPKDYKFLDNYNIEELVRGKVIPAYKGEVLDVAGEFVKDGITYLRPLGAAQAFTWYGIPKDKRLIALHDPLRQGEDYLETGVQDFHNVVTMAEKWFIGKTKLTTIGKNIMDVLSNKNKRRQ